MNIDELKCTVTVDALRESRIPRSYWEKGIDTYRGKKEPLNQVLRYCQNLDNVFKEAHGVFFRGDIASYKTFYLTYILKLAIAHGYTVCYIEMDELIDVLFRGDDKTELAFNKFIVNYDFLGIDDANDIKNSVAPTCIERVYRWRRDNELPTLLATKLSNEAFSHTYGRDAFYYVSSLSSQVECSSSITLTSAESRVNLKAKSMKDL